MKKARTIFLIARTHGLQSHLLNRQDFMRLLGARNLDDIVRLILEEGAYAEELAHLPPGELTAIELERIFQEKLTRRWESMLQLTYGNTSELLEAFYSRLEAESLKRIIRLVHGSSKVNEEDLITVPRRYQRINIPALTGVRNIEEIVDLLRETPYAGIAKHIDDYEATRNPVTLEIYLDTLYFTELWNAASKSREFRTTKPLIGTEVDLKNLELILTSKYTHLDNRTLRKNLIGLSYKLRKSQIQRLLKPDIRDISSVSIGQTYSDLLKQAAALLLEDNVSEMQNLFTHRLFSYVEKTSIRNPNNFAYVISYLYLCLKEMRNLRTIAIGKELKMATSDLEKLLFL